MISGITKKQLIISVIISVIIALILFSFIDEKPTKEEYDKLKEITLEIAKDPLNSSKTYDDISTNAKWNFSSDKSELIITAKTDNCEVISTFPVHSQYILDSVIFCISYDNVQFVERDLSTPLFLWIVLHIFICLIIFALLVDIFMTYNNLSSNRREPV